MNAKSLVSEPGRGTILSLVFGLTWLLDFTEFFSIDGENLWNLGTREFGFGFVTYVLFLGIYVWIVRRVKSDPAESLGDNLATISGLIVVTVIGYFVLKFTVLFFLLFFALG